MGQELEFHPVTRNRWDDLVCLFGQRGACGGCWCMWWRLKRSDFNRGKGEGNKQALKELVERGEVPGILAYREGEPVGWCSLGPRESYPALDRSRVLQRVDEKPVWSIVCFYIPKAERGKGLTEHLVRAAIEYARAEGAKTLEAYPIDPKGKTVAAVFAYTGFYSTFARAGFAEAARRSDTRPIMRLILQ